MMSSLHSTLSLITDIGDGASLLAITAACGIYLFCRGSRRAAVFLLTTLAVSAFFIAALKVAFMGCRNYFHLASIHSPSGHAADSAAVFWAIAMLMRSQLDTTRRFLPLALMTLLIIAIDISRVWLGYHSTIEVIIGTATGFISIFIARFLVLRSHSVSPFDAYALALWGVLAAFILHGAHLPAEDWLYAITAHLKNHMHYCTS